jgi:hypothetical protein
MKLLIPSLIVIILAVAALYSSQNEPIGDALEINGTVDAELPKKFSDDLALKQEEAITKYGKPISKSRESYPNIGGARVDDLDALAIPDNVEIYTYESNLGITYQVVTYLPTEIQSKAYGDDPAIVAAKTYTITGLEYSDKSASST